MRLPFLLIALALIVPPSLLRAGQRISVDRFGFSIEIPDSGWTIDTAFIETIPDDGAVVLNIYDEEERSFSVAIFNDPGIGDDRRDLTRWIMKMIASEGATILDTSRTSIDGAEALRITADYFNPDDSSMVAPLSAIATVQRGYGYILITTKMSGRPENDIALATMIRSFRFGMMPGDGVRRAPEEPADLALQSDDQDTMSLWLIFLAFLLLIGSPMIYMMITRARSRRFDQKNADSEWED